MIELLVIFALATVGVYFTTTTEMADGSRLHDPDGPGQAEDQGGIGILGIDIARRVRGRAKARAMVDAANANAASRGTDRLTGGDDAMSDTGDMDLDDTIRSVLGEVDGAGGVGGATDRLELAGAGDDEIADEAYEGVDKLPPLSRRFGLVNDNAGLDDLPLREDLPEALTGPIAVGDPILAVSADGGHADADLDEHDDDDAERDEAIARAIRAEMAERRNAPAPNPAPRSAPNSGYTPAGVPVVEDFDPEEDSIVIAYCRSEVGDGRIGITEDPLTPGTARVTLGGRVVALVPGGYGRVGAHHIELQLMHSAA